MTNVFEVLAATGEDERIAQTRGIIAAQSRAKARFASFLDKAADETEKLARYELVESDIRKMAAEVAAEYGGDEEQLFLAATAVIGGPHKDDCGCGFCLNKGSFGKDKDESEDESEETEELDDKEAKTAADVEDGDSYTQERQDVATGPEGSPDIDKSKVPDSGLKAIDVPSEHHPAEQQKMDQKVKYDSKDFDPDSPTRDRIDADKALQSEHNVADHTDTWTGTEGLADPVTSSANWSVL